jgi:DNA/RNA-binding domain of Phe-tRNA-synthetase-like protein
VSDPELVTGAVEPELAAEFPGLAIHWVAVEAGSGRSPQAVRERLKEMSNRLSGPRAVQMRQEPVPWAYRVFFRQVGIDPDQRRTPIEQLVLNRLQHGGFRSRNLLDDAIDIAVFETAVPVIAFDADRVEGGLGLRLSREAELMGQAGRPLSSGQIVIADRERALAVLFADLDPDRGVTPRTKRMLLSTVQVEGVPDISVEEALWTVAEIVTGGA